MKTPQGFKIVQGIHLPSPNSMMDGFELYWLMDFDKPEGAMFFQENDTGRVYELQLRPELAEHYFGKPPEESPFHPDHV